MKKINLSNINSNINSNIFERIVNAEEKKSTMKLCFHDLFISKNFMTFFEKDNSSELLRKNVENFQKNNGSLKEKSLNDLTCKRELMLQVFRNEVESAIAESRNKELETKIYNNDLYIINKKSKSIALVCSLENEKVRNQKNELYCNFSVTAVKQQEIIKYIAKKLAKNNSIFSCRKLVSKLFPSKKKLEKT